MNTDVATIEFRFGSTGARSFFETEQRHLLNTLHLELDSREECGCCAIDEVRLAIAVVGGVLKASDLTPRQRRRSRDTLIDAMLANNQRLGHARLASAIEYIWNN